MFTSELYKGGLFFLALGAMLDFLLIRWKEDLWLWGRVVLWEKIDRLHFNNYHQKIAGFILRPLESKWIEDYGSGVVLALSVFWSYFSSLIALSSYPDGYVVVQINEASKYMLYYFMFGVSSHLLMGGMIKYEKRYINKLSNMFVQIYRGIIFSWVGVVVLGLLVIVWIGIFPPNPGWRIAILSVSTNLLLDGGSVYVTIKILKWVAKEGNIFKGIVGPLIDVASAGIFLFLSVGAVLLVFYGVGINPSESETRAPISYYGLMGYSVFIPTILIGLLILTTTLLKISQMTVKVVALYFIDISADPNDVSHVRPFTMLGVMGALSMWGMHLASLFV